MSASNVVLIIISGLGVIHGLFLALFLFNYNKGNKKANYWLSVLLIILSFRIGKSVFLEFTEDLDVKIIFSGLSTLMILGPVFWFFVKSSISKSFQVVRLDYIHFIPSIIGLFLGLFLQEKHLSEWPLIIFASLFVIYYLHFLLYLVLSYRLIHHYKKHESYNESIFTFLKLLFYALLSIWFVYILNLFDDIVPYIIGPILYSIIAYVFSFIVITRGYIQKMDLTKYKTNPVSQEHGQKLYNRLLHLMSQDKLYKNSELNLKSISQNLNVSPQILSQVINQESGKNFNGFINSYRIDESISLFKEPKFQNHTIASIAFEVGFNSISSFNTAFKKQKGTTPTIFRKGIN